MGSDNGAKPSPTSLFYKRASSGRLANTRRWTLGNLTSYMPYIRSEEVPGRLNSFFAPQFFAVAPSSTFVNEGVEWGECTSRAHLKPLCVIVQAEIAIIFRSYRFL